MTVALLWDHDGVLVDTEGLYFQATREVLASVGVELSEEQYRQLFLVGGGGAWHLAAQAGVGEAQLAQLKARRNARYSELLRTTDVLLPGALALLKELKAHHRMAIVTSSRPEHFADIHRASGLPEQFELVLTREQYEHSKPHPEPYLTAMARMQLTPASCLVIEDSERGLLAAKAAGLCCWVVPSRLTQGSHFQGADRRFDSLAELAQALRALRDG